MSIVRSMPRRALVASAVLVVITLGHATAATAGTDGDVMLGVDNQEATASTGVSTTSGTGLHGTTTGVGLSDYGVWGEGHFRGVLGTGSVIGVLGSGTDYGSTGVQGYGSDVGVGGSGAYGVVGTGEIDGISGTGGFVGVDGYGSDGSYAGVRGRSTDGVAVYAESLQPNQEGVGLQVAGRSVFRTAGAATVPAGTNRVAVRLAGVTPSDFVLATVQGSTRVYVKGAETATNRFTIWLSETPRTPTVVAYFVISAS